MAPRSAPPIGAFITCPDDTSRRRLCAASTFAYSGPVPVASLATTMAALRVNEREGDHLRQRIGALTDRLVRGARELGMVIERRHDWTQCSLAAMTQYGRSPEVRDQLRGHGVPAAVRAVTRAWFWSQAALIESGALGFYALEIRKPMAAR